MGFSEKHERILLKKVKKNVLNSSFNLENISNNKKPDFVLNIINNNKNINKVYIKIFFWEETNYIVNFLKNLNEKINFKVLKKYDGRRDSGIILIESEKFELLFLKKILICHFNFENIRKPSLNIKLQLCIYTNSIVILYDIYDDRGFYAYYLDAEK